uniref:Uncharacterized protein n=1 Tax=Triticum urartu TaxID=4572 RepID=A0A8R7U2A7_TRIUA
MDWTKYEPTGLLFALLCVDVYKLLSKALVVMWLHDIYACLHNLSG